ncbi:MAG TPA: hypothetical protein PLF31_01015 [Candidatus Paceibacterota bacterium]|nr:hypothetical protein [Candidatus Paceibacterota bacterium]
MKNNTPKIVGIVVAIAVVIASAAAWAVGRNDEMGPVNESQPVADKRKYEDGTYGATGQYVSPAGAEEVGVTVTLTNDVITDVKFEGKAENPGSVTMQGKFAEGFSSLVVGKSIDEVSLSVVNGSSLTPKGFMDALDKIKAEAIRA